MPNDADPLNCTQILELKSSAEPQVEEAFFNQIVVLSQVGLILLANAKKNAIYVVHLDYGPNPAATRMDYISEFTVTMPILSLTGTSDTLRGQCVAQIYCVQTQAIQQYTLDLCQCLPPPLENVSSEKSDSSASEDVTNTEGFSCLESRGSKFSDIPISTTIDSATLQQDTPTSNVDIKSLALASSTSDADMVCVSTSLNPLRRRSSRDFTEITVVGRLEPSPGPSDQSSKNQQVIDYSVDQQVDNIHATLSDVPSLDSDSRNDEKKIARDDHSSMLNASTTFKHPTHLVTPNEFLVGVSSTEITNVNEAKIEVDTNIQDVVVNSDVSNAEVEVKIVGETRRTQTDEFGLQGEPKKLVLENKEKFFSSQASGLGIEMARECSAVSAETCTAEEPGQVDGVDVVELLAQPSHGGGKEVHESTKDVPGKVSDSMPTLVSQSTTPGTKAKKQKGRNSQASGPPSPTPSGFNSTDSSNEPVGASGVLSVEAANPQILAMQEMLNQVIVLVHVKYPITCITCSFSARYLYEILKRMMLRGHQLQGYEHFWMHYAWNLLCFV